jgi:biotin synthase
MNARAVDSVLTRAVAAPRSVSAEELTFLLACGDAGLWNEVRSAACEIRRRCGRDRVLYRALIECSNICAKDCRYCGIRRSNGALGRYRMPVEEVIERVECARSEGFDAVAFQGGEIESDANTAYYEEILASCGGLEVTLSLGEQSVETYSRWKAAGALRYLLRIETSNAGLYRALHPAECSFERRVECIRNLKKVGYITGTGVMIGFPGQEYADLADDVLFFGSVDADMVGMGPWIPHPAAALSSSAEFDAGRAVELSCRIISLTRLYLHDVNIVSATALEALAGAEGRQLGLDAGANVVMPNFTPDIYRREYDLYPGKTGCAK